MSEHNITTRPGLKGVITSKGNTKTDETGTIKQLSVNVRNNYVHNTNVQFINFDLHFNYLRLFRVKFSSTNPCFVKKLSFCYFKQTFPKLTLRAK